MQVDPVPPERSQRRGSWTSRIVAIGLAGIAASITGCGPLQRSLIYPARHYEHSELERRVRERFGANAAILAPFDAIVVEPEGAAATAIWFHGNGNVNTDFGKLVAVFAKRHVRLVLPECPGYGARAGVPSERVLVDDARTLYASIDERYPREPIVVIGQSLGSGVASQVAADVSRPQPQRLVLVTPFFDLPDAASHAFWNLPLQSIVNDRYDSANALVRYRGAVVVVVAAQDRFIGAESGRRLGRVARPYGQTRLIELLGADHNDWLSAMSPETWDSFLNGLEPRSRRR